MKKHLLIVGGGFAGFWAAVSAIRQSREIQTRGLIDITLINPDNQVTIRPAFNEPSFKALRFELDKYLKPLGIHQIVGRVEIIKPGKNELIVSTVHGTRNINYDYLVLASGASLKIPDLPGIAHTFNVDSTSNTQRLEQHILQLTEKNFQEEGSSTFIVVGSEFTALETVTSIEQKIRSLQTYYPGKNWDFRIILIESSNEVAAGYSKECKEYIHDVIAMKNIEVITNVGLNIIGPSSVLLSNGVRIASRTVIWTKGLIASSLAQFFTAVKDDSGRLIVDKYLKLPRYRNVIAAGNVARSAKEYSFSSAMDYQYAQFEGRWAGHNAVNDLFGKAMKEYVQPGYMNCVDLGEPRLVYADEWEREYQNERNKARVTERRINTITLYPWQSIEETVVASLPEIPNL